MHQISSPDHLGLRSAFHRINSICIASASSSTIYNIHETSDHFRYFYGYKLQNHKACSMFAAEDKRVKQTE